MNEIIFGVKFFLFLVSLPKTLCAGNADLLAYGSA